MSKIYQHKLDEIQQNLEQDEKEFVAFRKMRNRLSCKTDAEYASMFPDESVSPNPLG